MKKNIWKRIASLALALVLAVGLLPQKAAAAASFQGFDKYDISITSIYLMCAGHFSDTGNQVSHTLFADDRMFGDLTFKISGEPKNGMVDVTYSFSFECEERGTVLNTGTFQLDCSCDKGYEYATSPKVDYGDGYRLSINMRRSATDHQMKWQSNGDNTHTGTCSVCKKSVTENCSGASGLNCTQTGTCTTCKGQYNNPSVHVREYSASGNQVTESCGCGKVDPQTATLTMNPATYTYTGSPITTGASISYSNGWQGETKQPSEIPATQYINNTNAGTATVKTTVEGKEISTSFTIAPYPLNGDQITVELDPSSATYTGQAQKPDYTVKFNGAPMVEDTDYTAAWGVGDFTNADQYQLVVTGKDGSNFTDTKSVTYTIGKADPTTQNFIFTKPTDLVYNGKAKTASAEVKTGITGMGNITAIMYNGSTDAPTDAGTYTVTVNVAEGKNYNKITNLVVGSFTIAPIAGSITIPEGKTVTYDGAPVEYNDLNPTITTDGKLTVKWYDSEGTEIAAPTNAGTYQISISAAAGNNYNAVDAVKQTFTIAQKELTITANEQTITYSRPIETGTAQVTVSGLAEGDALTDITLTTQDTNVTKNGTITPSAATIKDDEVDVTANYQITYNTGNLTINAKEMTVTAEGYEGIYDGTAHGITVTVEDPADTKVEYSTDGENWSETTPQFTDVKDSATVYYRVTKDNYITFTDSAVVKIDPIEITVTVDAIADQPYTSNPITPAVTITDGENKLVEGENLVLGTDYTVSYSENNTNVGTVTVTINDIAGGNYTVSGFGTFEIVQADNSWITEPSISGWIYGKTPSTPNMGEAKFGSDTVTVTYSGTVNDGTEYTNSATAPDKAGSYTATFTVPETDNYKNLIYDAPFVVSKAMPVLGTVTTSIPANSTNINDIGFTWENASMEGIVVADSEQALVWGINNIQWTFNPKDTANYTSRNGTVTVTVTDTIAPSGTVSIDENKWNDLWNTITFDLFYKETKTVKVKAEDALSGIAKVEYFDSTEALTEDQVETIDAWTDMGEDFSQNVTAVEATTFIYYIRITDNAGNVTYISTADGTFDLTCPAISGIENGKTYYTTQKVTVTDTNLETLTLNGEAVTGEIILEGNKEATYTIVATDKAGNVTELTVTMKPIASIFASIDGITESNVNSGNAGRIAEVEATAAAADTTNATEEEKAELEALVDTVEDLLAKIEEVAQAPVTEDTEKVEDITSENVTLEDKNDLEKAKEDLEDALTENAGNYTEDEKKAIQEEIDRIDDALESIENVEAAEETLSKLPAIETVEPDDEDAIKAITDAKAKYDALTDHEKSLVDEDAKKKLDDLRAALVAYDIIKGENDKYTQGGSKGLSFTANGAYSKFSGVLVDNKVVDPKHYTAESGSTVITLKASYLDTLSAGKHTLTVVYTDGETSCEFTIAAKSATPATGDDSNIMLFGSMFTMSLAAIVVLLLASKKRKQENA